MVVVPVAAVNCSRPYSHRALILQAIAPLRKLGSGHTRLMASYLAMQSSLELPLLGGYGPGMYCESIDNRYA